MTFVVPLPVGSVGRVEEDYSVVSNVPCVGRGALKDLVVVWARGSVKVIKDSDALGVKVPTEVNPRAEVADGGGDGSSMVHPVF